MMEITKAEEDKKNNAHFLRFIDSHFHWNHLCVGSWPIIFHSLSPDYFLFFIVPFVCFEFIEIKMRKISWLQRTNTPQRMNAWQRKKLAEKSHILCAYKRGHYNLHLALNNSNDTQFHFYSLHFFGVGLLWFGLAVWLKWWRRQRW